MRERRNGNGAGHRDGLDWHKQPCKKSPATGLGSGFLFVAFPGSAGAVGRALRSRGAKSKEQRATERFKRAARYIADTVPNGVAEHLYKSLILRKFYRLPKYSRGIGSASFCSLWEGKGQIPRPDYLRNM